MDNLSTLLWICAVGGTLFFVTRLVLSLFFGVHHDVGGMHGIVHDVAAETDFKFVTFYTIFAFIMMFGWSGLGAYQQYNLGVVQSVLVAAAIGLCTMVAVAYLLSLFTKFTSPGDTFTPKDIVGQRATVYERIPADGVGMIQITYAGLLREVKATSEETTEIDSFESVVVCSIVQADTVSVKRVENKQ